MCVFFIVLSCIVVLLCIYFYVYLNVLSMCCCVLYDCVCVERCVRIYVCRRGGCINVWVRVFEPVNVVGIWVFICVYGCMCMCVSSLLLCVVSFVNMVICVCSVWVFVFLFVQMCLGVL